MTWIFDLIVLLDVGHITPSFGSDRLLLYLLLLPPRWPLLVLAVFPFGLSEKMWHSSSLQFSRTVPSSGLMATVQGGGDFSKKTLDSMKVQGFLSSYQSQDEKYMEAKCHNTYIYK